MKCLPCETFSRQYCHSSPLTFVSLAAGYCNQRACGGADHVGPGRIRVGYKDSLDDPRDCIGDGD